MDKVAVNAEPISKNTEQHFLTFLHNTLGLSLQSHQMPGLYHHIVTTCQHHGYASPEAYLYQLQRLDSNSPEMEDFIAAITVGESYFFRSDNQITLLKEKLLPDLIKQRVAENNKTIKLWSAGCCRGEELYTLAILLDQLIPDISKWRILLLGTDINVKALKIAREGKYTSLSMRNTDQKIIKSYFEESKNSYTIQTKLKERTHFLYLNLNDTLYPSRHTYTTEIDLILCRNVLIYFNKEKSSTIIERLVQCLCINGILMLGASDGINSKPEHTTTEQENNVFYYRKNDVEETRHLTKNVTTVTTQTEATPRKKTSTKTELDAVKEAITNAQWPEALTLCESLLKKEPSDSLLQYKLLILSNYGKLEEAFACCDAILKDNPMSAYAYIGKGLLYFNQKKLSEAENMFHKCIYLAPNLIEAHYYLGMLYLHNQRKKQGLKVLEKALSRLEKNTSEEIVYFTPNLDIARFKTLLQQEISLYEE